MKNQKRSKRKIRERILGELDRKKNGWEERTKKKEAEKKGEWREEGNTRRGGVKADGGEMVEEKKDGYDMELKIQRKNGKRREQIGAERKEKEKMEKEKKGKIWEAMGEDSASTTI